MSHKHQSSLSVTLYDLCLVIPLTSDQLMVIYIYIYVLYCLYINVNH